MLDFMLNDGKRMTLEDCGDCLKCKTLDRRWGIYE